MERAANLVLLSCVSIKKGHIPVDDSIWTSHSLFWLLEEPKPVVVRSSMRHFQLSKLHVRGIFFYCLYDFFNVAHCTSIRAER